MLECRFGHVIFGRQWLIPAWQVHQRLTRKMFLYVMQLLLLAAIGCSLLVAESTSAVYQTPRTQRKDVQVEVTRRIAVGSWGQAQVDRTAIDASILPDYWQEPHIATFFQVDPRVTTNGAEPPEQLVKVTDRKHKFPVFATICSISFLATIITLLIVCTS